MLSRRSRAAWFAALLLLTAGGCGDGVGQPFTPGNVDEELPGFQTQDGGAQQPDLVTPQPDPGPTPDVPEPEPDSPAPEPDAEPDEGGPPPECVSNADCNDQDPCTTDLCDATFGCVYEVIPDCCIPDCDGKQCGVDGCGGLCGECGAGETCIDPGICSGCTPECAGKECGSDGCGGTCGGCPAGWSCGDDNLCVEGCEPECAGKECGSDGCGGSCGGCPAGWECNPSGICDTGCEPVCGGKECGDDGCGGSCGVCPAGWSCNGVGACEPGCTPQCGGKECGDDGCGGLCGNCPAGWSCNAAGVCEDGCTPQCAGQECGDDGCGGLCGNCPAGWACDAGACVETCTPDCFLKDCGDDGCGGSCGSCPAGQSCDAFGTCNVPCEPDCTGKACGTDGCGGSCGTCAGGDVCAPDFTCQDPTFGSTCDNPFAVDALPFTGSGNTLSATDDYSAGDGCPGATSSFGSESADQVFRFVPPGDGNYRITVDATFDSVLYVLTDCALIDASTCLGAEDSGTTGEELVLYLAGGETYYVVVDGWSSVFSEEGPFTLTVEAYDNPGCTPQCAGKACGDDSCGGQCGVCTGGFACSPGGLCLPAGSGETCALPFEVGALPFSATGDTDDASADFGFSGGECPGASSAKGGGSKDHVYAFTPPAEGNYHVVLDSDFDAALYVAFACEDIPNSCVAGTDDAVSLAEELVLYLAGDTTYYIFVDGYSATSNYSGGYTLTVQDWAPTGCTPDCAGKQCGDDGCGGQCGACTVVGETCSPAGTCQPIGAGDTCAEAFEIPTIPTAAVGDTSDANGDYSFADDSCPGEPSGWGAGSKDEVYALTPTVSGNYHIWLESSFDAVLYVAQDCALINNSCLGGSDAGGSSTDEEVVAWLEAFTTYYVFVDGYSNSSDYSGSYTLHVDVYDNPGCTPDCTGKQCGPDGCGGQCGVCDLPLEACDPTGTCGDPDAGKICEIPFVVDAVPFSATADTSLSTGDYGVPANACPGETSALGSASKDHVYMFSPAVSGNYTLSLDPNFDAALYVVTDCGDTEGSCVGGADDGASGSVESLTGWLSAALTYFIIVDGYSNSSDLSGSYDLTIEAYDNPSCTPSCEGKACGPDGCGGQCGTCLPTDDVCVGGLCVDPSAGDTCDQAFVIDAVPYSAGSDTDIASDDYTGSCPSVGGASNDQAFLFVPSVTADYQIQVTDVDFDVAFYVTTDCAAISGNCLGGADSGSAGSSESTTLTLEAFVPVYIIVDGYSNASNQSGAYTLSVTQL